MLERNMLECGEYIQKTSRKDEQTNSQLLKNQKTKLETLIKLLRFENNCETVKQF